MRKAVGWCGGSIGPGLDKGTHKRIISCYPPAPRPPGCAPHRTLPPPPPSPPALTRALADTQGSRRRRRGCG